MCDTVAAKRRPEELCQQQHFFPSWDNLSEGTGGKLRTGSNFPHVAGRCWSIFQASGKV